jgi:hypothetical protein
VIGASPGDTKTKQGRKMSAKSKNQARYRSKMLSTNHGRLDLIVARTSNDQLGRLARHYKVPKRTVIENLVLMAEHALVAKLPAVKRGIYYAKPSPTV